MGLERGSNFRSSQGSGKLIGLRVTDLPLVGC